MNVITMASRKGGAGKSTLTAHLAAYCHTAGHRCVVIDADPQGSITLWHSLRTDRQPDLRSGARGIDRALAMAMVEGYEWAFIDTAASMWVVAQEAIRAATLVAVPARPGFFDLNAVRETVAAARERNKPYAVVLNAAPVKRDDKEAPAVVQSRAFFDKLNIPVWSGQVSQRTGYVLTPALASARWRLIRSPEPRSPGCGRRSNVRSQRSTTRTRRQAWRTARRRKLRRVGKGATRRARVRQFESPRGLR